MRNTNYLRWVRRLVVPVMGSMLASSALASMSGETLAKQGSGQAPACMSCHGANGEGNEALGYPRLAGLSSGYLQKQLHDVASGARKNAAMSPIASSLTDEQIKAVADYYAGLKPTPAAHQGKKVDQKLLDEGRELVANGQWADAMPACVKCHGEGARGVGSTFPMLAGQHASYLENQLHAWQQGTRKNDPVGVMAHVAQKLND